VVSRRRSLELSSVCLSSGFAPSPNQSNNNLIRRIMFLFLLCPKAGSEEWGGGDSLKNNIASILNSDNLFTYYAGYQEIPATKQVNNSQIWNYGNIIQKEAYEVALQISRSRTKPKSRVPCMIDGFSCHLPEVSNRRSRRLCKWHRIGAITRVL